MREFNLLSPYSLFFGKIHPLHNNCTYFCR
nr:MAG TPA: hypothetical protein [Caudoviricetes sp.]